MGLVSFVSCSPARIFAVANETYTSCHSLQCESRRGRADGLHICGQLLLDLVALSTLLFLFPCDHAVISLQCCDGVIIVDDG